MANQSYNSFPTNRWADSDTGSILDTAFASIDGAIRHLFGLSTNVLTPAFSISNPGVVTILHSVGIGISNKMIGILNEIPDMVGPSEDQQLATVQAIRRWVDGGELLAESVLVDTTNFNYILSPADVNVQLALDTIDDHLHDERYSRLSHFHSRYVEFLTSTTGSLNIGLSQGAQGKTFNLGVNTAWFEAQLDDWLPRSAGPTAPLYGNLHIKGFNDPGIFIGPESLTSFYTHIYDIGAYSYHDCFSGNNARLLFNPHPLNSVPTPPAGYMPGWGPYTSIFNAFVDFFAETNTNKQVKMRLYPGVGLRDGTPTITLDAKSGYVDLISSGRFNIGNANSFSRITQDAWAHVVPGNTIALKFNPDTLDFTSSTYGYAGVRINPRVIDGGNTKVTIDAINGPTIFKFLDPIEVNQSIRARTAAGIVGSFEIVDNSSNVRNVAIINSGIMDIGDQDIALHLFGTENRPMYFGTGAPEELALLSDVSVAVTPAHTHDYVDYVVESVTNGDPVTPEIMFDLDGDVVTIETPTIRTSGPVN